MKYAIVDTKYTIILKNTGTTLQDNSPIINPGILLFGTCDDWNIHLYKNDKTDITADFIGINFRFCPYNTFTLSNDLFSIPGSWDVVLEDEFPVLFIIKFNQSTESLNASAASGIQNYFAGVWRIEKFEKNMLYLRDDVGGKTLVFERGSLQ